MSGIMSEHLRAWLWVANWDNYLYTSQWDIAGLIQAAFREGRLVEECT